MTEQTVYCEECVEDIPGSEVYVEENRLYCKRCGSEVESPDPDIFEEIESNQTGFVFRDSLEDDAEDDNDEELGITVKNQEEVEREK